MSGVFKITVIWFVQLLVLCGVGGCSSENPNFPGIIDEGSYSLTFSSPSWSPQNIVVYRDNGGRWVDGLWVLLSEQSGIWSYDPSTGEKVHLVPFGKYPRWSPDGNKFSFWHSSTIWLYDMDSGEYHIVIEGMGLCNQAYWSPCGESLVFSTTHGAPFDNTFWTYCFETGEMENITPGSGGLRYPLWISECDSLLHKRYFGENGQVYSGIYVMDVDSLGVRPVIESDNDERGLAISPGGRYVGFHSAFPDGLNRLKVFDRSIMEFVGGSGVGGEGMSWLPLGGKFVFVRPSSIGPHGENSQLVVFNQDTGEIEVLF